MALQVPVVKQAAAAPKFEQATRQKYLALSAFSRTGTGGYTSRVELPKTGYAARLFLSIKGTVAGTLSAPNALGFCSILNRVRLTSQAGVIMFDVSGAGYHHLLRPVLESGYINPLPNTNGTTAVTAAAFDVSLVIPIGLNMRDRTGLFNLQNRSTVVTLEVDWATDSTVATGVTSLTATVKPVLELFTVPDQAASRPEENVVHVIQEDQQAIGGAGTFVYTWPMGNTYLSVLHGLGIGASGSDLWSLATIKANESEPLGVVDPDTMSLTYGYKHGIARRAGTIEWDGIGTSGLGHYGSARDMINSNRLSSLKSEIVATGAGTLYTIREMLIDIS